MIRMLSVAVLAIAVTTIFAQPMIPREYEAPAPVQVDSSQQIADRVISSKNTGDARFLGAMVRSLPDARPGHGYAQAGV